MNFTKLSLLMLYLCVFEASLSSAKPQNISMSASDGIYLTLTLDKVAKTHGSILTYGNGELELTKTIYNSYQFSISFKSEKIGSEKIPLEFSYNLADHKRDEPFILHLIENKICLIVEKACHRECLKYLNTKSQKTIFVKPGLQATKNASEVFGRKSCNFYNLTQIAPHTKNLVSSDFCMNKWQTYSFKKSIALDLAYNSHKILNDFIVTNDGNYVLLRSIYGEYFTISHLQIDVFTPSGKQIATQKLEIQFSGYVSAASLTLDPKGFIYAYIAMYAPPESRSAHIFKFNSTLPHTQIASIKAIYGTDPSFMFSSRFGYLYFIAESNYAVYNASLALLARPLIQIMPSLERMEILPFR